MEGNVCVIQPYRSSTSSSKSLNFLLRFAGVPLSQDLFAGAYSTAYCFSFRKNNEKIYGVIIFRVVFPVQVPQPNP